MFKFTTGLYLISCLFFTAGILKFTQHQYRWDLAEENDQYIDSSDICRIILPNNSQEIQNKQCFANQNAIATIDQLKNTTKVPNIRFATDFKFIRAEPTIKTKMTRFNFRWIKDRKWRKITASLPENTLQLYLQGISENGTCLIKYGSNEKTPLILYADGLIYYFILGGTFLFTGAILYLVYG